MRDYFTPKGRYNIRKVREMLLDPVVWKKKKPSVAIIDEFIQQFWYQDLHECILMIPWITVRLIGYIRNNNRLPTRFELYQDLISSITKGRHEIIKDLYKIGIRFELLQQNQLPVKEFTKTLKKLKLQTTSLQWLLDRKLVEAVSEEVDGKVTRSIKWFHHTFTEFLAADWILTSSKEIASKLNSLAIVHLTEDNTDNIKPSWNGVIGFLLGSSRGVETLEWVVSMIEKNPLNLFETLGNSIVLYALSDVSNEMKDRVFQSIYGTIQDRCIWIRLLPSFGLWRFYTKNQLAILEAHCKQTSNEVETYVHRGNAVAYFTELIRHKKISAALRNKWKARFISFAQDANTNGVLQRYSLDALELYQDPRLVKILKPYYETPLRQSDQLLSQAFVEFCTSVQKKNKESVEVLINASKQKMDVYGRHGLQDLSKKKDIILFLHALVKDPDFLERFIDSESIFSGDSGDEGDRKLIGKIVSLAQKGKYIQKLLYDIIVTALNHPELYDLHRSYMICTFFSWLPDTPEVVAKLLKMAQEEKKQNKNHFIYQLFDLLPVAFTSKNWKILLKLIEKSGVYPRERVNDVIYRLRWLEDEKAKQLFSIIAKQRKLKVEPKQTVEEQNRVKREKIYKDFQWKLQPEPGQYMTDVFEYYLQNAKIIDPLKPKDKKRLLYLAYEDGVKRLDPNKFNLKITDFPEQRNQFSWSRQAAFFGDMVRVIEKLGPKRLRKPVVQQHLIDFVPFAYTSDLQTIRKHVTIVTESQLLSLNNHIIEKDDHRRYHLPDSYVSFVEHLAKINNIRFCLPVLRSLIGAEYIDESVSEYSLKVYGAIEGKTDEYRKMLSNFFIKFKKSKRSLAEEANRQLIEIFSDENAINWRITQIKERIQPFTPPRSGEAHSVGLVEEEFDSLRFAKPLFLVNGESIFHKLIKLYKAASKQTALDNKFSSYSNYIWKILLKYIEKQKFTQSFQMQKKLIHRTDISAWQKEEILQIRLNKINGYSAKRI